MDPIFAHLIADHISLRNNSERSGQVVYIIAKDGFGLRAGEIFISPRAYALTLARGGASTELPVHWLDQSPAEHVQTYPVVTISDIVMNSLSIEVIATIIRRHRQRMARIARNN